MVEVAMVEVAMVEVAMVEVAMVKSLVSEKCLSTRLRLTQERFSTYRGIRRRCCTSLAMVLFWWLSWSWIRHPIFVSLGSTNQRQSTPIVFHKAG